MSRFSYSIDALDRKQGRTIPVKITDITEKIKDQGKHSIPSLVLTYEPPDKSLEIQEYAGGPDCIPSESDLGRLIKAFSKMSINRIDENNFSPLRNKYFWLTVTPIRTADGGVSYKRYPVRPMTEEEISQEFGLQPRLAVLKPFVAVLESKFDGVPLDEVLSRAITIPEIRPYMKEVSECVNTGELQEWLASNTGLAIHEGVLRRQNGNRS